MSMDCVRDLSPEEDDHNAWTFRNCLGSFLNIVKSPFRHTYGIRNAGHPVKGPLGEVREAVAVTTTVDATSETCRPTGPE